MYYPSSENKGADQLRGYREADLRLCFRICRLLVFPWGGSFTCDPLSLLNLYCLSFTKLCKCLSSRKSWKVLTVNDEVMQSYYVDFSKSNIMQCYVLTNDKL